MLLLAQGTQKQVSLKVRGGRGGWEQGEQPELWQTHGAGAEADVFHMLATPSDSGLPHGRAGSPLVARELPLQRKEQHVLTF